MCNLGDGPGKPAANPPTTRPARPYECPIHGVGVIRLENRRFAGEMTAAMEPARDGEGRIDVPGTMQIITSVVQEWVREYPAQWPWLHRRWR